MPNVAVQNLEQLTAVDGTIILRYVHNPLVVGMGVDSDVAYRNLKLAHISLGNRPDGYWYSLPNYRSRSR